MPIRCEIVYRRALNWEQYWMRRDNVTDEIYPAIEQTEISVLFDVIVQLCQHGSTERKEIQIGKQKLNEYWIIRSIYSINIRCSIRKNSVSVVSWASAFVALLDEMKHFLWLIVVLVDSAFARYGVNSMDATRDDLSDTVNVVDSLVRCVTWFSAHSSKISIYSIYTSVYAESHWPE